MLCGIESKKVFYIHLEYIFAILWVISYPFLNDFLSFMRSSARYRSVCMLVHSRHKYGFQNIPYCVLNGKLSECRCDYLALFSAYSVINQCGFMIGILVIYNPIVSKFYGSIFIITVIFQSFLCLSSACIFHSKPSVFFA